MMWARRTATAVLLCCWVMGALAQVPQRPRLSLAQALALPFAERFEVWFERANGVNPEEGLAIGDSMVAEARLAHDKVWIPAQQAIYRTDRGMRKTAEALLQQADEAAASLFFRSAPNSGEPGHWKAFALHVLADSHCYAATRQGQFAEADRWCAASVERATTALELVRYTNRSRASAEDQLVTAYLRLTDLRLAAGQVEAATAPLESALKLERPGERSVPTLAWLYRSASRVAQQLGQHDEAVRKAHAAIRVWDSTLAPAAHGARLWGRGELQNALALQENWPALLAELEDMDRLGPAGRRLVRGPLFPRALALASARRLGSMRAPLQDALAASQRDRGDLHPITALLEGLLGAALLDAPEPEQRHDAGRHLQRAAQVLIEAERLGDLALRNAVSLKTSRLVLAYFLRSLEGNSSIGTEAYRLAFGVADAMRASRVQSAIQSAALRDAAQVAGLGELVAREQALQSRAQLISSRLQGQGGESVGTASAEDEFSGELRSSLLSITRERQALLKQIEQAFPAFDRLVRPTVPTPEAVVQRLAVGELFLLMLPVDEGIHVWALSWSERAHHFVSLPSQQLTKQINELRASTDFSTKLPPYAVAQARELAQALLGPLEPSIRKARHVVIAAGGQLGTVPFAALPYGAMLPEGEPWLIRQVAVSQVPSAGAWLAIQRRALSERPTGALLAWGDPTFDARTTAASGQAAATRRVISARNAAVDASNVPRYSDLPPLPETRDELLAIAQSVKADPARDLVMGRAATRASVLAANQRGDLATRRVIAFATHGLMAGDLPNLNQPALALSATPDAETNPLAPLLTLDDVLGLKLNADWVVLSACNTAAADGKAEEALSGLARGFFYAGARSVLVTHWAVETESAKLLTTRTFEHYTANPYAGKAESLRQAMLSVMTMPQYRHPAFWAPYALVGDGAR